ncbi:MAG TPA: phage head closure protein [Phycisphaerae bacterium]|nr:phage head closure protein [Phycisphaerae bacterium]
MCAVAINPGRLKTSVVIQHKSAGRDTKGARTAESWRTLATVWAEVLPVAGREGWNVKQIDAELTHGVVMRYRSDVTSRHRLKVGTAILNIKGPPRDVGNAHVILELDCIEEED